MSTALSWLVIGAAGVAALLAMWRIARRARRHRLALIGLQPLIAAAFAAALLLPAVSGPARVHVLTEGPQPARVPDGAAVARLPGTPDLPAIPAWPDLASLLRAQQQISELVVYGHGLADTDLAAAGAVPITFVPADLPLGIVELEAPVQVRPGALFPVHGRVRAAGEVEVRLLDPAGRVHDRAIPDADGAFALHARVPTAGRHAFELTLQQGEAPLHTLSLGVAAVAPPVQRGLLLAGAPSAELHAFRRWAIDAGLALAARITLAPGLSLQDAPVRLDAATLDATDLVILDERSWPTSQGERDALHEAMDKGLGVLLRITGPLPAALLQDLREQRLVTGMAGEVPMAVALALETPDGSAAAAAATASVRELHAWPVRFDASAAPLITAADGGLLGAWRPTGQGRFGVLAISDSHRLQARAGAADHATLWSGIWARLARGTDVPAPSIARRPLPGQRTMVCGGTGDISAVVADATTGMLPRDPAASDCAAWYPGTAGWHHVQVGTELVSVHVPDSDAVQPLRLEQRHAATAAAAQPEGHRASDVPSTPPWRVLLLASWVLLLASSWLLERRTVAVAAR